MASRNVVKILLKQVTVHFAMSNIQHMSNIIEHVKITFNIKIAYVCLLVVFHGSHEMTLVYTVR